MGFFLRHHMRQMRNIRTGRVAVYDADLIESGRWEEVTASKPEPVPELKPSNNDDVLVKDEAVVTLIKGKHEGKQRKA